MEETANTNSFKCNGCGADLTYQAGTTQLTCQYCGAENEIPVNDTPIEELDYHAFLQQKTDETEQFEQQYVKCESCGASSTLEPNISSAFCPYCSTPLLIEQAHNEKLIQPKSMLPFKLDKKQAQAEFKNWISKLWFAPGKLKKATINFDHFKGVYIPYWTYDTDTHSFYIGQRGDYYYVTETYTAQENGKSVTKTRQVRKTRWHTVSGNVDMKFDDILVPATESLPRKYIDQLEPWDLENLTPFEKSYLSGFISEKYQVSLEQGFDFAKEKADAEIRIRVRHQIGGDEQRITSLQTGHNNITFKHLLLPVYVSAYKFKNKLYQFLVNGRTGEVQGQRPYSAGKIIALVLAVAAVIAVIVYFTRQ